MRALLVPTIFILIILLVWGAAIWFTTSSTELMFSVIEDNLIPAVLDNQWDEVDHQFTIFQEEWDSSKKIYTLYMSASAVTDIDLSVTRTSGYIAAQDTGLVMGEISSIIKHLEELLQNQSLSLDNLF